MNLRKMSLAAVVVVASLGTASVADVMISGKSDFRFKSLNEFSRDRIDVNLKAHSADKMGMVHAKIRHDKGKFGVLKLYAKYNVMGLTVGAGPKISAQGRLSFGTNAGIVVTKKVAGIKLGASMLNAKGMSKQVFSAAGKMGMLGFAADFQMGDAKQYVAALAHAKVGPAKLGFGYAMNTANTANTMMGASVNMKMGAMGFGAGGTLSGAMGDGKAIVERTSATGLPAELGSYAGSQAAGVMAFYAKANMNVMGHNIGAYGSFAGPVTEAQLSLKKKINAQSKAQLYVTYNMNGAVAKTTTEVRLFTKF